MDEMQYFKKPCKDRQCDTFLFNMSGTAAFWGKGDIDTPNHNKEKIKNNKGETQIPQPRATKRSSEYSDRKSEIVKIPEVNGLGNHGFF